MSTTEYRTYSFQELVELINKVNQYSGDVKAYQNIPERYEAIYTEEGCPDKVKYLNADYDDPHEFAQLIQEIRTAADQVLISNTGQLCYTLTQRLKSQHNVTVTVGERDSFGPLSAVIFTDKGKIVFG